MLVSSAHIAADAEAFLKITSREQLAAWLNVTDHKLRYLLYALKPAQRYRTFAIRKKRGGTRIISAPEKHLKSIQRHLNLALTTIATCSPAACGFVRGKSIVDHAKTHSKKRWVLCVDLEDFFPSINFGRVRGMFMSAPFNFNQEVATCLAQLCTDGQCLPQGAPTSPVISNIICIALDNALMKLCRRSKSHYSRYADDICISSNTKDIPAELASNGGDAVVEGKGLVDAIEGRGFKVNKTKTKLRFRDERQLVTGLVVNRQVATPRKWRRQLRVMLHLRKKHGDVQGRVLDFV